MTFFPDGKTFVQIGSFSIAWYAICIITGAFISKKSVIIKRFFQTISLV